MNQYSKSIAAFLGMLALFSKDFFGIEIGQATVDSIVNGLIALGTVYAVYQAKNAA